MAALNQIDTTDGTLTGAVDGTNRTFTALSPQAGKVVFWNGLLMTQPVDYVSSGASITLVPQQTPHAGDIVSEVSYNVSDATPALPLNIPVQFSSVDGSLSGARDGVNNVFTLTTSNLVTQIMLWWNGVFLTFGLDYVWTCTQAFSSGAWSSVITMRGGTYPLVGDILTAQVFGQ